MNEKEKQYLLIALSAMLGVIIKGIFDSALEWVVKDPAPQWFLVGYCIIFVMTLILIGGIVLREKD